MNVKRDKRNYKKTLENTKLNMKTTHKNKNTIMLKTFKKTTNDKALAYTTLDRLHMVQFFFDVIDLVVDFSSVSAFKRFIEKGDLSNL